MTDLSIEQLAAIEGIKKLQGQPYDVRETDVMDVQYVPAVQPADLTDKKGR